MERNNLDFKSISAKISRDEFTLIDEYCKRKGITASSLIREILLREIEISIPHNVAGRNMFEYKKDKDNFSWFIQLDDGNKIEIIKNCSADYIQDLNSNLNHAIEMRNSYLKKSSVGSVSVPSSLVEKKK
ncbi:hypothetical protein H6501_02330 [Candidatus Woesearchaeota archaeon]|nr:hypothetical protein [Candidatus Woesearchaeota archaeon]USN44927.1 MAG: hypothetical protein H6500_03770 [Candidatus Woesearchaeota archaeon]